MTRDSSAPHSSSFWLALSTLSRSMLHWTRLDVDAVMTKLRGEHPAITRSEVGHAPTPCASPSLLSSRISPPPPPPVLASDRLPSTTGDSVLSHRIIVTLSLPSDADCWSVFFGRVCAPPPPPASFPSPSPSYLSPASYFITPFARFHPGGIPDLMKVRGLGSGFKAYLFP